MPLANTARQIEVSDRNYMVTNNNAVDVHVGSRIRLRRTLMGMSQEQLGQQLNITFQQVQKYERGANRVSASRLWDISQILDVDISYFFEDMTRETRARSPRRISSGGDATGPVMISPIPWHGGRRWSLCGHIIRLNSRLSAGRLPAMVKSFAAMISTGKP